MKRILKIDADHYLSIPSETIGSLPVGVYKIELNEKRNEIYAQYQFDKFTFNHKIYEMESEFIDRAILTYQQTNGNLGILLNGLRGTGKSITAKLISNKLNLPVIIINKNFGDGFVIKLKDFISELPCDAIILFDEFEKVFVDESWGKTPALLTLMDGIDNSEFRRVFLMTTNELHLNQNYLERPSRIRYIKTYTDLRLETIIEIIDDILVKTEFKNECVEFISKLNIITIDIVKAVINEVNIHNQPPEMFRDIFNIKTTKSLFDIYEVIDGKNVVYSTDTDANNITLIPPFSNKYLGRYLDIYSHEMGEIISVKDENTLIIKDDNNLVKTFFFSMKETKHKSFVF